MLVTAAYAQNVTYVSTAGSDANACTRSAPCRTLAAGAAAASVRGEVRLLDSGDFGSGIAITRSLTISGNRNTLFLSGANAISVNNVGATVALRDLVLDGRGTGSIGVVVNAAASVHIVRCGIIDFRVSGVFSDRANAEIFATDMTIRGAGATGLDFNGRRSGVLTVDNSTVTKNAADGVRLLEAKVTATNSTFATNGDNGIASQDGSLAFIRSSALDNDGSGVVFSGGTFSVDSSVFRGNLGFAGIDIASGIGSVSSATSMNNGNRGLWLANGATLLSRANNRVRGNPTDVESGGDFIRVGGT